MNVSRTAAILVGLGVCAAGVAMLTPGGNAPPNGGEDTREHAQAGGGTGAEAKAAPPIDLEDMAGQAWSLASLRDKRAALVVFWASW